MGRPKQPAQLRQNLMDQAVALILSDGLAGLTTEAVARAAGVSKGGLFHHFPSKPALVEAVVDDLLVQLTQAIAARLPPDTGAPGRFTRAYVAALLQDTGSRWSALSIALVAEPAMLRRWDDWIAARMHEHAATDAGADLAILRLAADGLWLAQGGATAQGLPLADLLARLDLWQDRITRPPA